MIPKILAYIRIAPRAPLGDVASELGTALGLEFRRDETGRYEEFPAYLADGVGMHMALLGPPAPEADIRESPTQDFILQIHSTVVGSDRELDLSDYFVALLKKRTTLEVWIAQ